jgi:hypothetical protein
MMKVPRTVCSIVPPLTAMILAASLSYANSDPPVSTDFERLAGGITLGSDFKVADKLTVNPDPSYRIVVPDKCQEQGEVELIRLVEFVKLEEAFAFIPSLCLWVETGFNETGKTVRLDTNLVAAILQSHPEIILYHIHPGRPRDVTGYFPAYSDLIGSVLIDAGFLSDPNVSISHRAITVRGLIDYAFVATEETERLLKKMKQTGLGAFVSQNLAYEYTRGAHEQRYYKAVRNCVRLSNGAPENLSACFPMKADDFILQYHERSN